MSLDLLIVNPGAKSHLFPGKIGEKLSAVQPPYWAALVAAYVRDKGYKVDILDAEADDLDSKTTALKINNFNPSLVCMSVLGSTPSASSTPKMTIATETIRELKKINSNIPVVWNGIHPSALPEKTLRENGGDFVSRGEGFTNITELLNRILKKEDNFDIQGICYVDEQTNKFLKNQQEEIVDANSLPIAAWDLLPIQKYKAHNWHCFSDIDNRAPYAALYTAYGCPFKCTYCNIHELYSLEGKPGVRFRSPDHIMEEIDYLVKNYNVKNFKFADELFTTKKSHIISVCEKIIERKYDLNIWTFVRAVPYPIEVLKLMRKAGFTWVAMGIESFVDHVREGVDKNTAQEKLIETINMYKEADINIIANFIFGLPDDTLETMNKTLEMAMEFNFEYVDFYTCMAYPGSQLYQESIQKNLKLPDSWHGYSQLGIETLPLPTKTLTGEQVLEFRDQAFIKYFNNPKYIENIRKRFGEKAVDHVKKMMQIKLERKFVPLKEAV